MAISVAISEPCVSCTIHPETPLITTTISPQTPLPARRQVTAHNKK